jgi:hypothetical protein
MKKLLLLAAVATVGVISVGYGSEDNSYSGNNPISEEKPNDEQSAKSNAVGGNGEKAEKRINEYLFLDIKRYEGKSEYITSILLKDSQNRPYSEQERNFMARYKEFILHESGVADDVADYLLEDKMSSNIILGMPATIFTKKETEPGETKEFDIICMDLQKEKSTLIVSIEHALSNFIFDTSVGINGVPFAKDLIVLGDCTMSGELNVGRYLFVKKEATLTIEAKLIVRGFILPGSSFSIGGSLIIGGIEAQQTIQTPGMYILRNEPGMTTKVTLYEGGSITYSAPITVEELLEQYDTVLA